MITPKLQLKKDKIEAQFRTKIKKPCEQLTGYLWLHF